MIASVGSEAAHRMPFGSPMTTSSGSSSTSSPPLKQRVREKLQANTPNKASSSQLATLRSRPNAPSLNLLTDFAKSGSLEALNTSGHKRQESLQERRNKARRNGSKGPVGIIKSANSRVSGLSPSDRTLVIGIALQPEKVDAHRGGLVTHDAGVHKAVTPEIVITPAALENPWNLPDTRYRPRSSVYSQATQYARGVLQAGSKSLDRDAPPVPQLPLNVTTNAQKNLRPLSAVSWHTDLGDDEDRDALCRRYSGESQLGILRAKSFNTPSARRPSRGWWNTLLSPLLDRSNTVAWRKSAKTNSQKIINSNEKKTADLPGLPVTEVNEKGLASPGSPKSDITAWEENRNTLAFFNDSPTGIKQHPDWQRKTVALSPDFVPEKGFGEAAEYFEACWHDLHSPTPFFECQNHTCRRLWFYRHGSVIGGPDAVRETPQADLERSIPLVGSGRGGIGAIEGDNGAPGIAHDTSRALSISSSTSPPRSPKSPHVRNLSDSTDIDDEPDAASEVEHARSFPGSKGVSPVPEHGQVSKVETAALAGTAQPDAKTQNPPLPETMPGGQTRSLPTESSSGFPSQGPAATSSPVLTPGLKREFASQNAIPMQQTRTTEHSTLPQPLDPLQIDEPRAAPRPPQPRPSQLDPTTADGPGVTTWSPLGHHPVEPRDGLGIDAYTGPRDMSTAATRSEITRERPVSHERSATPVFQPPPRAWPIAEKNQAKERSREMKKEESKDRSTKWKLAGCFPPARTKKDKRRRRLCCLIGGGLLAMVILIVVLVLTLTIPRDDMPIQDSWLNITGFPPIPTGIATVAQPNAAVEFSQCVAPSTMWSCAVPKEQQQSIAPNQPDQPNFRIEIRFQNGSAAINSTNSTNTRRSLQPHNAASAGQFIRDKFLRIRDPFTNSLFTPNPSPPSQDDQAFLGNTTDNNTAPFAGEATPFFVSFLPTTPSTTPKLLRRQDLGNNGTNPFPNISIAIPPPSVNSDGTAAAANLYPYPSAQPLQLYNRGRSDEHYGFYTYFDRSIFLRSQDLLNSTSQPNVPDDEVGGAEESAASFRCTWTQTRFLVQIWTNAGDALSLLSTANGTNTTTSSSTAATTSAVATTAAATSTASTQDSADDFSRPGSFPYPVSITMDRHGGDITKKMIYCYGMDENERIVSSEKEIHIETRDAGGPGLVNAANGIFAATNVSTADGGPGGIDGGVGGCRCLWQNWASR